MNLGKKRSGRKKSFEATSDNQRQDHVEAEGTVSNVYVGGRFLVELEAGPTVKAEISGRMRRYRIRVLLGDRVRVALSPYDLTHGLLTYRFKDSAPPRRVA